MLAFEGSLHVARHQIATHEGLLIPHLGLAFANQAVGGKVFHLGLGGAIQICIGLCHPYQFVLSIILVNFCLILQGGLLQNQDLLAASVRSGLDSLPAHLDGSRGLCLVCALCS